MITEKDISKRIGRAIKSPIRVGNIQDLGIDTSSFIRLFVPFFDKLQDDVYLVRGKQIEFLKTIFSSESEQIERYHRAYFEGLKDIEILTPWISRLSDSQKKQFEQVSQITRQRNISSFIIEIWDNQFFIERSSQEAFQQNVGGFREWKRVFTQASSRAVENELFFELLKKISTLVQQIHPKTRREGANL